MKSAQIKARALELGFDKVGIVAADSLSSEGRDLRAWLDQNFHGKMTYMARDPERRLDPRALLPSASSVVAVALNYFRPGSHSTDARTGKISRYAWGDDYHDVLREKLNALLIWVQERAPEAEGRVCVDSSPTMDKAWAVRAGLGWIGKHTNLITKELGSWVFLGELLLSIELEYDDFIEPDHCGTCTACLEACPTGAFTAPYQIDARRCISYGTIELRDEELPELLASKLENWVFGCDICQDICPWSRFSKGTSEGRFAPRAGVLAPLLEELEKISDKEFSSRFRGSAVKRAKANGLRRNARAANEYQVRKEHEYDGSASE